MMEAEFWSTLDRVLLDAGQQATAIMCSETLWWRCHRRLIADAAVARGFRVLHIMRSGVVSEHAVRTPGRVVGDRVSYSDPER